MKNLKKIGIVVAVIAVVLVIAVVVIANWGDWLTNLTNGIGQAVGVGGIGDAVFGDTEFNSQVDLGA